MGAAPCHPVCLFVAAVQEDGAVGCWGSSKNETTSSTARQSAKSHGRQGGRPEPCTVIALRRGRPFASPRRPWNGAPKQAAIRNSGPECRALDGIRFSRHGTRCSERKKKKRARLTRACRRSTPHLLVLVLWPNCEYSSPRPLFLRADLDKTHTSHTQQHSTHSSPCHPPPFPALLPPCRRGASSLTHSPRAIPTPTNSGCPLSLFLSGPAGAGPLCSVSRWPPVLRGIRCWNANSHLSCSCTAWGILPRRNANAHPPVPERNHPNMHNLANPISSHAIQPVPSPCPLTTYAPIPSPPVPANGPPPTTLTPMSRPNVLSYIVRTSYPPPLLELPCRATCLIPVLLVRPALMSPAMNEYLRSLVRHMRDSLSSSSSFSILHLASSTPLNPPLS